MSRSGANILRLHLHPTNPPEQGENSRQDPGPFDVSCCPTEQSSSGMTQAPSMSQVEMASLCDLHEGLTEQLTILPTSSHVPWQSLSQRLHKN